jgi:hypothetical protein
MKLMRNIFKLLLTYIFTLSLPLYAKAIDLSTAAETGDRELIGVGIAFVAFVVTAYITLRLTKRKNKINKK